MVNYYIVCRFGEGRRNDLKNYETIKIVSVFSSLLLAIFSVCVLKLDKICLLLVLVQLTLQVESPF
jgi:hypothetical protein